MNKILWAIQIILGLTFLGSGAIHFLLPPDLPEMMAWMYDLSPNMHTIVGTLEIFGALGLILPGLLKTQPRLTPVTAAGLAAVMLGAIVYHFPRGEYPNIGSNTFLLILSAFVAYQRWTKYPLLEKSEA
jgi:uncharacterized membrane protein YphA (DoxX/SURF4 family)